MRNFILEGKKIARPVLFTTCLLTLLTCILYREYTIHFELDPWEIGTEFLSLLFPLFVTVPICWQLYYERRDRFLTYTLPRISRHRYLTGPFIYVILENFFWAVLGMPGLRFVTAFEPGSLSASAVHASSFAAGPVLMCIVMGAAAFYYQKVKKRSI